MDYDKPIKSLMVKQLLQPVAYFDTKVTAEILKPGDFNEVIKYVSSNEIHNRSTYYPLMIETNNKYLLFGPSLDLLVSSRDELKINGKPMTPASEKEVDKRDLILGIVALTKSMKSAAIQTAEEKTKGLFFPLRTVAISAAKKLAESTYIEVTALYENYKARLKKIRDLAMYIDRKRDAKLLEILLTVPKAAFEVDKPPPGKPPVYAPGGKPAVPAVKPAQLVVTGTSIKPSVKSI